MKIEYRALSEVRPYGKNPRKVENAVRKVEESISKFGFINPIIVNADNVILAGHTRLKALKEDGVKEAQVIRLSHMTEQEEKAFRIADNRVADFASWDGDLLEAEMEEIGADDWELFGFKFREIKPGKGMCTCPKCGKEFKR